ncbi:MAG: winged helix-turn-helix transcriptional regulator [Clostridia bacterium]|nr:winged helix-turn-helix transcriptional regulator [Clostridia bacterium]
MIDRFEKFSFTISEISRYWHKLASDEMEQHGLKGPQAVYFTTMYQHPNGITAVKLAELCSRDKADVSRAVAQFEKKGLVEKVLVNDNFYRAPLKLTETGMKLAERINEKAKAAVANGGKGLTEEQRTIFYNALERICANLRTLTARGL